ncbi:MAG: hypothetical protein JW940_03910 [Polyangiaceae bacterium]|nr:hypothetical protein [Polyangiaceae bacterium]
MRPLTPVETAVAIALGGSLCAVTVPAFVRNLHASRLAEPIDGLNRIATRATALAAGRPAEIAYPETVGLTPANVPQGKRVLDPPGTWDEPTWRRLDFELSVPHAFSFSFESHKAKGEATFRATAHGDLDGDGVLSTFALGGQSRDGSEPTVTPLEVTREVE